VTLRAAVLVSGTGRHLENFARLARAGELDLELVRAVASKAGIAALERARSWDVPARVLDPERALDEQAFSERLFGELDEEGCEWTLCAGFLRKLVVPPRWEGRVLNIHPSLLPAFGGQGFYGRRVHEAVIARGSWFTGTTVHYVDNEYDHGRILLQRVCRVLPDDTPDSLAERVFAEELVAYPDALRLVGA